MGSYTGEVNASQIKSIGTNFALIGHQERRKYFNEDNDFLKLFISTNKKNYLITVEIINDDYKFVDSEDMDKIIDNEKFHFDIDYWSYNITYDQLGRLFESGKILIPNMQRGFVWDDIQASRLIESILMGLPLPSLFLVINKPFFSIKLEFLDSL